MCSFIFYFSEFDNPTTTTYQIFIFIFYIFYCYIPKISIYRCLSIFFAADKTLCLDGSSGSVTGKKSRVLLLMHTKLLRKFWNEFRYSGVVAWRSRIHVCRAGCSGMHL